MGLEHGNEPGLRLVNTLIGGGGGAIKNWED